MSKQTLGGDRLGSGAGTTIETRGFQRSSHDMGYIWKSSMAAGTLVPFMVEPIMPGSSMDIDLETIVMTHPTIGPLFGSYKIQLDVYVCPLRLYNAYLHMNALNIGLNMSEIKIPQMKLTADGDVLNEKGLVNDNEQINSSSLLSYLNIRGLGQGKTEGIIVEREFNALPYLMYWDIYKNYYANKQEGVGMYISNDLTANTAVTSAVLDTTLTTYNILAINTPVTLDSQTFVTITLANWEADQGTPDIEKVQVYTLSTGTVNAREVFNSITWDKDAKVITLEAFKTALLGSNTVGVPSQMVVCGVGSEDGKPAIRTFELENIDEMRMKILSTQSKVNPFIINEDFTKRPYSTIDAKNPDTGVYNKQTTQEGLALKTYQSDLFNNWISTEWIDGDNGVNELTAVDTTSGQFTMDALNMAKKVYDMLNGIAGSGGSYNNWVEVVYDHNGFKNYETPIYVGGLIRELTFEEVVSNSGTSASGSGQGIDQPLGTLAGRGSMTQKKKGGKINVRVDEPSYVMGIISLTPRLDYSQGNKWDGNIKTMDDWHKPYLDEIGFQDLITDQMHWGDTKIDNNGVLTYKSAGKVPAWINYMTNVNQIRGNFAEEKQQMFMTLNRRYEAGANGIDDLTTYIDPSKFNNVFADTRLDAQNFWVQIKIDNIARRKMSAKVMPNL